MVDPLNQTTMGRNDKRILGRIVMSNGGGYDVTGEPQAPVDRLRNAGLIQMKPGNRTLCLLYIHTVAGKQSWSNVNGT